MPQQDLSILGAGESGVGAALLAKQKGCTVFVSDKGRIAEHYKNELLEAGIPLRKTNIQLLEFLTVKGS